MTTSANCFIIRRLRLAFLALLGAVSFAAAQTLEVVALASGEAPFLAGGSEAPAETNVFTGEAVESYYLPVRLDYVDGSRYLLGIGSAARFWADRIELQGVSLEIAALGTRPVITAQIELRPSPDCRGTIYTDDEDVVTLYVETGTIEAYTVQGQRAGVAVAGEAKTFAFVEGALRVQENRGPLEMARILLRELNYAVQLEEAVPPFGEKRKELSARLVDSTDGVLLIDAGLRRFNLISGPDGAEGPTIDPERVRRAAVDVSYEIHHSVGWSRYGCGIPSCMGAVGVVADYPFGGDPALAPRQPVGCRLCAPQGTAAP